MDWRSRAAAVVAFVVLAMAVYLGFQIPVVEPVPEVIATAPAPIEPAPVSVPVVVKDTFRDTNVPVAMRVHIRPAPKRFDTSRDSVGFDSVADTSPIDELDTGSLDWVGLAWEKVPFEWDDEAGSVQEAVRRLDRLLDRAELCEGMGFSIDVDRNYVLRNRAVNELNGEGGGSLLGHYAIVTTLSDFLARDLEDLGCAYGR